eukprot:TRINITY_DN7772_c0_g1_i1.p2 TRINITY_DN7772_c0_g1~~TRINITY_DN7772_c0_g1_i1.p2  ORF type:complete len:151 (+),score=50.43 TRINITY_DN7772_c0_g1_i1:72-524(+)
MCIRDRCKPMMLTMKPGTMKREQISKALILLQTIEIDPQSREFQQPVDYVKLGLADYPDIIETPMDLSTVKKKLKGGKYFGIEEIMSDIQLIWDNCRAYNQPESGICKMADYMENFTKKTAERLNIYEGVRRSEELPFRNNEEGAESSNA